MRILFTPLAVHSHVLNMVPFAWACRAAGHQVRFATQPRGVDTVVRAGLPAVTVGASFDFQEESVRYVRTHFMKSTSLRSQLFGGKAAAEPPPYGPWTQAAEVVAPELVAFARAWEPDLVVTDPMFYAGPLVAEVLGVPLLRLLWGPDWTKAGCGMGGFAEGGQEPPVWPVELVELFESYGARTAVDFAAATIEPFPPSLQIPGLANRVTMRPVPFNGSGVAPGWLTEPPERPRVCLTWGTSISAYLGEEFFLLPQILSYLGDLDIEVVVAIAAADRGLVGQTLPAGARVVENLPLDLLLPSCSGIVNQGGSAVVTTAAVHGVPQVTVPVFADQPANAELLAATGAGLRLDPYALDAGAVRAAVTAVVSDGAPRAAALRLRDEIGGLPAPAEIVGRLPEIMKTPRPVF